MTLSLGVIDAMVESGCTAAQLAAAIRADVNERVERRLFRALQKALFPRAALEIEVQAESASFIAESASFTFEADSMAVIGGAATAAGGSTKAVARAALLMAPGLRPAARAVGARLIEHVNLRSGRCDPGLARLARDTGLSSRSVRRAVGELVTAGFIGRAIHGGAGHRNAYAIGWSALAGAARAAEVRNGEADSVAKRTLLSPEADTRVRQNLRRNPDSESVDVVRQRAREKPPRKPSPDQREILFPMPSLAKSEAAYGAAGHRLWGDLDAHFRGGRYGDYAETVGSILAKEELCHEATLSEMRSRGSGLRIVLTGLAHGPPKAAAG